MLPQQVVLNVVSTDTVAKGDEKSPQYKPAIVGSGRKIMVPPFIAQGKFFDSCSIVWRLPSKWRQQWYLSFQGKG